MRVVDDNNSNDLMQTWLQMGGNMSEVEIVSRTDVGLVRDHNEDRVAVFPDKGLVLLADGMGGYNAGEVASQLVVDTVSEQLLSMHEHLNGLVGKKR